jgi:hypothetical protein
VAVSSAQQATSIGGIPAIISYAFGNLTSWHCRCKF